MLNPNSQRAIAPSSVAGKSWGGRKSLCFLFPMLLMTAAQGNLDEKAKKDLESLQGAWVMHTLEINGKAESKIQETFLNIKKDEYKTSVKGKEPPGFRLKLDPSKEPKWLDMIQTQADGSEKVFKAIYTIEKDTLKICRGIDATQDRPGQFATWPDTGYFMVTWKKK
jgi:uncharacterized protein (TIGR03067 family)